MGEIGPDGHVVGGGEWLTLHGAPVRGRNGLTSQIAVTIDTAGPTHVVPLIFAAFGLTERERDVVRHVLGGASTNQIAERLHLSAYTVQDHLKVIFDKVGVTSRRGSIGMVRGDLIAHIFHEH
jgi:DNA-binding CsgD family transcriptional regulator